MNLSFVHFYNESIFRLVKMDCILVAKASDTWFTPLNKNVIKNNCTFAST